MKNFFLSIIFFFISLQFSLYSQEGGVVSFDIPANSSLKLNKFIINPTFSFVRENTTFISLYNKRQWSQFENAPQSYLFSYSGKFRENDGLGIGLFQQNYGILTTFGGIVNYAHNVVVNRENNLTFGANLGFYKSGLDNTKVITNSPDTSLDNIPSNSILTINPGINYGTGFLDFGISANNIVIYNLQNSQMISDAPSKGFEGHVMYTGFIDRYGFFEKSKFSGLLKAESRKDKTIFSTLFLFNVPKAGWIQAGYNNLYGASGGLGFTVSKRFSVGYNFEKGLGNLSNLGNSHEFFLAYMFRDPNDDDDKPVVRSSKTNGSITKAQALANIKARDEARAAKLEADRLRKEKVAASLAAKNDIINAKIEAERLRKEKFAAKLLARTDAGKAKLEEERIRKEQLAIALKEKEEKDLIANAEAEKARLEAERLSKIKAEEDLANSSAAEKARLAKEAADKVKADIAFAEAEKLRLAKEAADNANASAAEKARLAKEAADKVKAEKALADAEKARLAKEAADNANASAAEKARLAKEAADKAKAEKALADAEKARLAKEAADKAAATASENARLAKEAADKAKAEKALADTEKARLAKEAADNANASAAEKARLAKEAADKAKAEKALADAEKARLAKEAADKATATAAENARLAKEAADKAKAEKALADAEKARLAKEAADKATATASENARLAKEAADKAKAEKALADAEKARLAKEAADKATATAAENARLAKEAADKAKAEKALADAEKARLAKEAADKATATAAENARLAKEAADKAKAEKALADAEKARLAKEAADKAIADKANAEAEKVRLANEAADLEKARLAKEAADLKAKAEAEAERLRKEAEDNARLEAKGADEKQLDYVSQVLEDSNRNLQQSLLRLDSITKSRLKALDDMKKENDDSEKGIISNVVKPFVNGSIERKALESLKQEIADATKDRNKFLTEYEGLLNERLKRVSNKNDAVNQSYLRKIENLKSDKLKSEQFNADLISKLDKITIDTEIEKKRRIKKADYQSGQGRYDQDRLALKRIKETTVASSVPLKPTDFDYGDDDDQSNMQILKSIDNAKSGFYLILAVHKDISKRDAFLTKMVSAGEKNVDFFYSVNTSKYFIYVDKFDSVLQATTALEAKGNKSYNGKMFVVKIEN